MRHAVFVTATILLCLACSFSVVLWSIPWLLPAHHLDAIASRQYLTAAIALSQLTLASLCMTFLFPSRGISGSQMDGCGPTTETSTVFAHNTLPFPGNRRHSFTVTFILFYLAVGVLGLTCFVGSLIAGHHVFQPEPFPPPVNQNVSAAYLAYVLAKMVALIVIPILLLLCPARLTVRAKPEPKLQFLLPLLSKRLFRLGLWYAAATNSAIFVDQISKSEWMNYLHLSVEGYLVFRRGINLLYWASLLWLAILVLVAYGRRNNFHDEETLDARESARTEY